MAKLFFNIVFTMILLIINIVGKTENSQNNNKTNQNKCHVLALQGGGDHGAYQAGVLRGLINNLPNGTFYWDVITGISVGSLNGAALSIFDIGQEKEAVDFIIKKWTEIEGKGDIYQNWFGSFITGLLFKTGLYDTSPEREFISSVLNNKEAKRKIISGATNIEDGGYETFDEDILTNKDFIESIMASSAVPVIFPTIELQNKTYVDGGVKIGVDIFSGIVKCNTMGFDFENIIVDVVLCNSKQELIIIDPENIRPLQMLNRVFEIQDYDSSMRNIDLAMDFYKDVSFRYLIGPSKKLPSGKYPLRFKKKQIEEMISIGVKDAEDSIKLGEGEMFKKIRDEYKKDRIEIITGKRNHQYLEQQRRKEKEINDLNESDSSSLKFLN